MYEMKNNYVKFETSVHVDTFVKTDITVPETFHKVIIAIKHNPIEYLESLLLERSTPGSALYQKWMSYEEITSLTKNKVAVKKVESWLEFHNVSIVARSHNSNYIEAVTSIEKWSNIFKTSFFVWEDVQYSNELNETKQYYLRSEDYSIPEDLVPYIITIFNVCDAIPKMRIQAPLRTTKTSSGLRRQLISARTDSNVNIPFLKQYYYATTSYNGKY